MAQQENTETTSNEASETSRPLNDEDLEGLAGGACQETSDTSESDYRVPTTDSEPWQARLRLTLAP